jgi:hypothetical protein
LGSFRNSIIFVDFEFYPKIMNSSIHFKESVRLTITGRLLPWPVILDLKILTSTLYITNEIELDFWKTRSIYRIMNGCLFEADLL